MCSANNFSDTNQKHGFWLCCGSIFFKMLSESRFVNERALFFGPNLIFWDCFRAFCQCNFKIFRRRPTMVADILLRSPTIKSLSTILIIDREIRAPIFYNTSRRFFYNTSRRNTLRNFYLSKGNFAGKDIPKKQISTFVD